MWPSHRGSTAAILNLNHCRPEMPRGVLDSVIKRSFFLRGHHYFCYCRWGGRFVSRPADLFFCHDERMLHFHITGSTLQTTRMLHVGALIPSPPFFSQNLVSRLLLLVNCRGKPLTAIHRAQET